MKRAQTPQPDAQALTADVQCMRRNADGMRLVFWMPREYRDATITQAKSW